MLLKLVAPKFSEQVFATHFLDHELLVVNIWRRFAFKTLYFAGLVIVEQHCEVVPEAFYVHKVVTRDQGELHSAEPQIGVVSVARLGTEDTILQNVQEFRSLLEIVRRVDGIVTESFLKRNA